MESRITISTTGNTSSNVITAGSGLCVDPNPPSLCVETPYIKESPKHFNCVRCGAPNQIDVCEYCGCAYEERN